MKACTGCGEVKPMEMFSKKSVAKDGRMTRCKACRKVYMDGYWRSYQATHRAKYRAHTRAWQVRNAERIREERKSPEHRARAVKYTTAWVSRNRGQYNASRRKLRRVTPAWANKFFIQEAYTLAQHRTAVTGIEWHVDHIVPIRSSFVCGLHVEHNLRVVPAAINRLKSNKLDQDLALRRSPWADL